MTKASRLTLFIRDHGHEAYANGSGTINALEIGTIRTDAGVIPYREWVILPADTRTVYHWLGY